MSELIFDPLIQALGGDLSPKDALIQALKIAGRNVGILPTPEKQRLYDESKSVMPELTDPARAQLAQEAMMGMGSGGVAGTLAGKLARTANMAELQRAMSMKSKGALDNDIWQETGWGDKFKDKQWKFEIPDNEAQFADRPVTSFTSTGTPRTMALNRTIDHPELFAAYPELAKLKTNIVEGRYGGDLITKTGRTPYRLHAQAPDTQLADLGLGKTMQEALSTKVLDTVLHEGQHATQALEDMAPGGNVAYMAHRYGIPVASDYAAALKAYKSLAGEAEARMTENRREWGPTIRRAIPPWQTMADEGFPVEQQFDRRFLPQTFDKYSLK